VIKKFGSVTILAKRYSIRFRSSFRILSKDECHVDCSNLSGFASSGCADRGFRMFVAKTDRPGAPVNGFHEKCHASRWRDIVFTRTLGYLGTLRVFLSGFLGLVE